MWFKSEAWPDIPKVKRNVTSTNPAPFVSCVSWKLHKKYHKKRPSKWAEPFAKYCQQQATKRSSKNQKPDSWSASEFFTKISRCLTWQWLTAAATATATGVWHSFFRLEFGKLNPQGRSAFASLQSGAPSYTKGTVFAFFFKCWFQIPGSKAYILLCHPSNGKYLHWYIYRLTFPTTISSTSGGLDNPSWGCSYWTHMGEQKIAFLQAFFWGFTINPVF